MDSVLRNRIHSLLATSELDSRAQHECLSAVDRMSPSAQVIAADFFQSYPERIGIFWDVVSKKRAALRGEVTADEVAAEEEEVFTGSV